MNILRIKFNPKETFVINIQGTKYHVQPQVSGCKGCVFDNYDNILCPAWDLTCKRESRGSLCSSFVDESGQTIPVLFKHWEDTQVPQVFIEKPVWEKELRQTCVILYDSGNGILERK